jgi:hypothetical protein
MPAKQICSSPDEQELTYNPSNVAENLEIRLAILRDIIINIV